MLHEATSLVAGDGNVGHGYGTLHRGGVGSEYTKERSWPYRGLTDVELEVLDDEGDEEELDAVRRQRGVVDALGRQSYRTHSFVNGATRGLTGIMSGVEPRDILEQFILEVGLQLARGAGGKSYDVMGPFDARTRPGRRTGSKKGWFSPPAPHDDPDNEMPAYSLEDIADDEDRAIKRAVIRRRDATRNAGKETLERYVSAVVAPHASSL